MSLVVRVLDLHEIKEQTKIELQNIPQTPEVDNTLSNFKSTAYVDSEESKNSSNSDELVPKDETNEEKLMQLLPDFAHVNKIKPHHVSAYLLLLKLFEKESSVLATVKSHVLALDGFDRLHSVFDSIACESKSAKAFVL